MTDSVTLLIAGLFGAAIACLLGWALRRREAEPEDVTLDYRRPGSGGSAGQAAGASAAAGYTPGRPTLPMLVLITVILAPCVITMAARLGRLLGGR